jgi:UDP-N-acetylglucosamine 2-epimerase (non-hydrolysing)
MTRSPINEITAAIVAGARPNYMKIAPIYHVMTERGGFRPVFVHTGQHYDWKMSQVFLRDLGLSDADFELGVGSGTHAQQTAQVMLLSEPILASQRPDVVVVVGDVNSTLGAALAAVKLGIPVAHVEAGLRSFDRTMPEEINRLVTDVVSDSLLAPSRDAVVNLRAEGIPEERIYLVGNVMIDSLEALLPAARRSDVLERLSLTSCGYFLATLHRPSNVDTDASLGQIVDILTDAAQARPVLLIAHPRTQKRLRASALLARLEEGGVRVLQPLGYVEFLRLMSEAAGVLTDSGGIQEETTVLGVPCLTIRENTERPITISEGTNQLVGLDRDRIMAALQPIITGADTRPLRPELWDGHAAERIVEVLRERYGT